LESELSRWRKRRGMVKITIGEGGAALRFMRGQGEIEMYFVFNDDKFQSSICSGT
jgi:hypothetical protein